MKKLSFDFSTLIIFVGFFISLLFTYSYIDFSSNMSVGVGHVYTAKSLALSRNFNVNEYWGNSGVDVITASSGDKYVAYAPLNAVIMAVPYFGLQVFSYIYTRAFGPINGDVSMILESLALSLPSTIFYSLIGILLFKQLQNYKVKSAVSILTLIGLLFGTILINYSVSFFNHVQSAFFIFYAYYLISSKKSESRFLYAGILTGLAFLTEFPTILFSISVGLMLLCERKSFIKRVALFSAPVILAILLLGIYNKIHFGSFFLMAEQILYQQKQALNIGAEHAFTQNPLYGIWGLYLSPLKGLFLISPFLVFSIPGFMKFIREEKTKISLAILSLSYVLLISLLYSFWPDCFGATPFGPRYLISAIPFLALYSAFALIGKFRVLIYSALVLFGIFICLMNVLDGLPSGKWFGQNCQVMEFGSYRKAYDYFKKFEKPNQRFAPILL
ncbi:hypothetical protein CO058_01940 [candidate division WWE3 bacterium CG_4_9_14_0_2_um_filter_35_11]|uniref:Glycosyltransferase RgtA/B/C/D-like domain-containing protein n=1 Tax=candidate division WWE3 bacterium CG_4_9_14_0_2_um_filter_35_11 TaxID=1975077 RepID=A0A2M8EM26_UNCKA|nr:MAG: hypothetical protein COV25_01025 [candidate division WWE3 bacterium CG10_big_fil_rev_8_21_14_0_10_35_32]PJC23737.1 MAG: hypothetical protein CO058_01940 [candidate division WWE3 bacterium CG_4_9_14_0_2_um_filter_35_11]